MYEYYMHFFAHNSRPVDLPKVQTFTTSKQTQINVYYTGCL
jgi:hypothetical protein